MTTLNPGTRLSSPELAVTRAGAANPGAVACLRVAGRLPGTTRRPDGHRGHRPGRVAGRAGGQQPPADPVGRRGLVRGRQGAGRRQAMVGAGHRARARRPGPAVRHLYPKAARRAPRRGAARRRRRALGHCRRAVGRRRRRTLHGGPLRCRSGNADTAPEAGHGAAGIVMTRSRRRNAGWRYLRARRLAIATERSVAQGPTRCWRPGNRRARPGLMMRPGHPGQDSPGRIHIVTISGFPRSARQRRRRAFRRSSALPGRGPSPA